MSGKTTNLRSFVRSTWLGWVACFGLGALTWVLHATHETALTHRAFISGWALVAAMLFLTAYNFRKKLDFLPAMFASRHWLWAHLVIGYWSVWVFVLHVGLGLPEGILESVLWVQFWVVIGSGVFGHYISRRFPRLLADRGQEALYQRIPVLIRDQRLRVEAAVLRAAAEGESSAIPEFYTAHLLPFLTGPQNMVAHLFNSRRTRERLLRSLDALEKVSARGQVDEVAELREAVCGKDDLDFHYAHQALLKFWLFVHVPLAYSLLVVAALHVVLAYAFGGMS